MLAWLLYRGGKTELLKRFPFFYGYLAAVLASDGIRLMFWRSAPAAYNLCWWITEAITSVIGFGITWQVYSRALAPYEGVKRMARSLVSFLFAGVLLKSVAGFARDFPGTTADFQRDLRFLQASLLVAIVGLMLRYALPAGRNLRGMLLGYGFYIGCNLIALGLRIEWGESFQAWWTVLPGLQYSATLAIWCAAMWSYYPEPTSDGKLELDYERISAHTIEGLGRLRNHLTNWGRP